MKQTRSTILITGCSSGIGLYCAQQLHARGYQVIASCRKAADVERLKRLGLSCVQIDLAQPSSIESGWNQALQLTGGKIDQLFNNGAYGQPGALEDLPTDALRQQFESNFFGWHHLSRLAIAHMLEQQTGRIIQNSSVLGLVAMKYRGAYNASKFAIEGYTDTLRLELADTPVKVCLIEPGPITSLFRKNAKAAFEQHIDSDNTRHQLAYQLTIDRLEQEGPSSQFTLPPSAVFKALIHALEAPKPKARYYVTFPTHLFAILRRILPVALLDIILRKS
ncbi:SDR family oxidoreductase [Agarivorans sp. TSD2052]|uniref:SDR family oxidoreductase n=1 Tax=Agarivorans sp. TSD2052 TaxID=2937286 RepID=UPI00200F8EF7|nr:SDR family oxidoreductase [Agarivorans sp. TSD2052]UPW17343.1 SDR family oxidoreductase [Agarivorans sp. TSD2052]